MPHTRHIFCLHHFSGNVSTNVRNSLGAKFVNFNRDFWATYRAVSPDEFDSLYKHLVTRFPAAHPYLDEELYPCRHQWAWAWVSSIFTGGIQTNGCCEAENRVNKAIGGPKKTLFQLFEGLNESMKGQTVQELARVRDNSHQQHENNIESIFRGPLQLCRKYLGPFALNMCYTQMQQSCYYKTEVLQRPKGIRNWNESCIKVDESLGYDWENDEEKQMINPFANDNVRISAKWLLWLIDGPGLNIKHLLCVTPLGTNASHHLVILADGHYICDCCMGTNLGIPCRHYFQILTRVQGMKFNVGLIWARWYQNPSLDLTTIPMVGLEHSVTLNAPSQSDACLRALSTLIGPLLANPLEKTDSHSLPRLTDTLPT
ncbi:hypothetical protein L208DRAFT_1506921 [Tricholoma matsutake]|nr:hypothetical protein L208DRAFT_1506921 [Tricholoma matsutake 945]